ncbi:MAG: HD domain-containing phosphohydrolase [Elusimicrobiota bacterium]
MSYTKMDDLEKLCNLIVEYATNILQTETGSLMLVDKTTNKLKIVASRGLSREIVESTEMDIGEGIAGRVAEKGNPIYCSDIEKDVRFMRSSKVHYVSKSFIAVPLKVKDKVIGVLNVNSKEKNNHFGEKDKRLINILADQAAAAIENINLYRDMKDMYIGTIKTLAEAIDAKDPYTRGHAERVTKYSVAIAKEMDLDKKLLRNIEFAALIHDIGKIGIKDNILFKPGKLTDSEYEKIQQHPKIGEQIISPVEFLINVAPLVLYHHEYYNGQGYPEGLKGKEIPIGARILTVADSFEAMISDRPYKKGFSIEEAVEELKSCKGEQFDPEVVEAFLKVLERDGENISNEIREFNEKNRTKLGNLL